MTKTLTDIGLENWQCKFVQDLFDKGARSTDLETQPAPWVIRGLQLLENHELLTPASIRVINAEGGTDHPDPYFG